MKILIILLSPFLLFSNCIGPSPTIYYVDATLGNDLWSGKYPDGEFYPEGCEDDGDSSDCKDGPWKTIRRVNLSFPSPNDSVLFKRGEIWREQLLPKSGNKTGYILYGAYGIGNKPLILGSIEKNNPSDWINVGHNLWQISKIKIDVGNIIFNDGEIIGIKVWNEEDLNEQGEFWYDEENKIVKLYSLSNPANFYEEIELALRSNIIDISNQSYIILENLELRYGGAHGIGGSNLYNIIIRGVDISYIGGGDQYGGENEVRFGNGIEFWENAQNLYVEKCKLWEIYDAALTNQGLNENIQKNIYFQNNIIWNSEYCFEYWNNPETSITNNVHFENNTCINSGGGWGHTQRIDPSGRHLCFYSNNAKTYDFYVRNNIFYQAKESGLYISGIWNGFENAILDYNLWYQPEGSLIIIKNVSYNTSQFSQYQEDTAKELHSLLGDPLFIDIESNDYHIQFGSPAIDNGTFVGIESDFDGNKRPQGAKPDIGAYEYVAKDL